MSNLIVSSACNASCNYCFANTHMRSTRKASLPVFMSLDEFEASLDFLDRSGINEARLLGGEPTLHPNFPTLINKARQRNKSITVFTHGLMPETALWSLLELPVEACTVIVNMSASFTGLPVNEMVTEKRLHIVKALGKRVLLGFNIQSPCFDLGELFHVIHETNARNSIRIGIALPGSQATNHFIHPKQYRLIGRRVAIQSNLAARENIHLDFDCGFVRCMFSDEELALLKANGVIYGWHCSPVLDICPGGNVLHCFSLSDRFTQPFSPLATSSSLHAAFNNLVSGYRQAGVYRECSTCSYKINHECSGGCLSATLRRFQPASIYVEQPQNN